MKTLSSTEIKRLNREWRRRSSGRIALLLAGLSNPYNVGSILRTSAVLGVELVYLVGATPAPGDPKVAKTGLGTERNVVTRRVTTLAEAAAQARTDGFAVIGLELASGATPIVEYTFPAATCLMIGNEGHGLALSSLAECEAAVYVPQVGRVASLNVATATSIAVYEVRRCGWQGDASRTPG